MSEEKNQPQPIETEPMSLARTGQADVLDIRDASARGLALMREKVAHFKQMTALAVSITSPNQWVVFEGKGPNGEQRDSVYPTGGAAERVLRHAFGFGFRVESMTVEDTGDGRLATCEMSLILGDRVYETFKGYRYIGGYIKNDANLRSGAEENAKSKAVRSLLGLRFLNKADYKEIGLDLDRLERRASFESHEKQGTEMVAPFGRSKGKPLSELPDDDLEWLANTVKGSIEDPAKEKFKTKNQALLQACREEYKRRHTPKEKPPKQKTEQKPEQKTQAETEPPPPQNDYSNVGPPPMTEDERAEYDETREREPGQDG